MEITHQELESIQILHPKGALTFGDADLMLQQEIEKAIVNQTIRIVLDLREVTEIDSTCASTIIATLERLKALGGGLALAGIDAAQLNPIEVAKLETDFEPFEFVEDAVNSFFPGRHIKRFDIRQLIESGNITHPSHPNRLEQ